MKPATERATPGAVPRDRNAAWLGSWFAHRDGLTVHGADAPALGQTDPRQDRQRAFSIAAALALLATGWLVLVLVVDPMRFVIFDPRAGTGFEVLLAIGQMLGAFVLAISPIQPTPRRLRWVAGGLLVFGIGAIGYGYLYPSLVDAPSVAVSMYGSLYVRTVGTLLCAIGLAAPRVPGISSVSVFALGGGAVLVGMALVPLANDLPELVRVTGTPLVTDQGALSGEAPDGTSEMAGLEAMVSQASTVFPGLTGWYLGLALVPLTASIVAAWGVTRRAAEARAGTWLVLAITLMACAQLHSLFWPSMHSSIVTTTSILRLAMAVAVVVGVVVELRVLTLERDALLGVEQERTQRLEEIARLKADFTAIVAHELANPVAAIRTMAQVMAIDDLPAEVRRQTVNDIVSEARLLEMLVQDVRDSASIERDAFHVAIGQFQIDALIAEAAAYARNLPGGHPVAVDHAAPVEVRGDADRIGQVVRNLLGNAARHTPDHTPITIRTRREHGDVVVEIADEGQGIPEEDLDRIFEKFGRGRDAARTHASGRGLGLYLSRQIMLAHDADLCVMTGPNQGTTFTFRLKELP